MFRQPRQRESDNEKRRRKKNEAEIARCYYYSKFAIDGFLRGEKNRLEIKGEKKKNLNVLIMQLFLNNILFIFFFVLACLPQWMTQNVRSFDYVVNLNANITHIDCRNRASIQMEGCRRVK